MDTDKRNMSTLYRKYRPKNWRDVAGQEHVKTTLAQEVRSGRAAHAYLFSGPRGVGKTTVARILARALNCDTVVGHEELGGNPCGACGSCLKIDALETMDIIEMDAASNRGIDAVRDNIIENSRFAPSSLIKKVFIIDEVHMLTTEAFNALLKTLEEPPNHAVFILATTELHKVPATVISRCQRFDFRKIPFAESVERLAKVAEGEGVSLDKETLEEIARTSEGCLRDAESLLGKVVTLGDGQAVSHEEASVVLPRSDWRRLGDYLEAVLDKDATRAIEVVQDALADGAHATEFADGLVTVLRAVMLTKLSGDAALAGAELDETRRDQLKGWAERSELAGLVQLTELMMEKRRETKFSHPPQLPLELAAVKASGVSEATVQSVPEKPSVKTGRPKKPSVAAAVGQTSGKARPKPVLEVERASSNTGVGQPVSDESVSVAAAQNEEARPEPVTEDVPVDPAAAVTADEEPVAEKSSAVDEADEPVCSLDRLIECWPQFVKRASEVNFSLPYLLGIGRPVEVRGPVAVIGFGFAFHCERFNDPKQREQMEAAFSEVLGKPVRLEAKLVVEDKDIERPVGPASGAVGDNAQRDELAEAFGGEVVS